MVDVIRNKWCEDLEEILQCRYCMIIPQSDICQCAEGHHICKDCYSQHVVCPTCNSEWSSARNRLAEDLCSKLNDMKLSLIDPETEINKLLIPDKVSIACQTNGSSPFNIAKETDDTPQGSYPCCIGRCKIVRLFEPMLNHLRTDHPDHFLQLPKVGNVFGHTWTFEVTDNMNVDWAVQVTDMGTFFLKLSTDLFGNLTGFVLMIQNAAVSKQYSYQLQVYCCLEHTTPICYGTVRTCRSPSGIPPEKCLQINRSELHKLYDHKKQLQCKLILTKRIRTEIPNRPQKAQKQNHPKKNNNAAKQPTASDQSRSMANRQSESTPGPSRGHVPASVRYTQSVSVLNDSGMVNRRSFDPFTVDLML